MVFVLLIYVELYTDIDIFSFISPFWAGFVEGQELWTRSLYFCIFVKVFCFGFFVLLYVFINYLLLMYCFNCHNSMSFCIFKLSLYIFIVVIIVGLTTVISFVKLNI